MLTSLDYTAIIGYIVALLIIGYVYSRRETAEGFLISDRKLSLFSAAATVNASKTGAVILIYTIAIYDYGLSALWYFVGVLVGYGTFIPFVRFLYARANKKYYTLAEYFYEHYGRTAGICATIATLATQIGFLAVNLIACAKVLSFFSPLSLPTSAILIACVILVYLFMAGFKAVVKTDLFQYLAILFILVVFLIPLSLGAEIPKTEWTLMSTGIGNIASMLLLGIIMPFGQAELWQRVYAMPNVRRAQNAFIIAIVSYLPVIVALTGIALLIKAHLPGIDPDIALVQGLATLLPMGMAGLAVVVFFACFMSSIDTYTYTAASSIVQDIIKQKNAKAAVKQIRMAIPLLLLIATLIAIFVQDLLNTAFIFSGFYMVLAIPTIAFFLKKNIQKTTISTCMVVSIASILFFVTTDLWRGVMEPTFVGKVMIMSVVGLVVGGVVSFALRMSSRA
jgi:Na+/proline symporter